MPDYPETPEGAAAWLTERIIRAETGQSLEHLTEQTKPRIASNQSVRSYILGVYSESLATSKGGRPPASSNGGAN